MKINARKTNLIGRLAYINKMYPRVKRIYDANRSIHIEVKDEDCATGKPNEPDECALAKAIKRQFHSQGAIIGLSHTYIIKGDKAFRFQTSSNVQREITSFDRHKDFASGVYTISKIAPTARLGNPAHRHSGPSGKHKKPRVRAKTARIRKIYEKKRSK